MDKTSILSLLEPDHHAAVIAEVTLVVVAPSEGVAEPGQHKIKLCRPDGKVLGQGDIETSTNHKIPGIVARVVLAAARAARQGLASAEQAMVGIGVGAAEEGFDKGFPMLSAVFENRPYVVGEHIPARFKDATCRART